VKIAVVTAACYPSRDRIHLLDGSAHRQGIELIPFGLGVQFANWRQMLMTQTLPTMRKMRRDFTHFLYVDACDSLFVASLDEIAAKYERAGEPQLFISGDTDRPQSNAFRFTGKPPWKFLNAGGFISEGIFFVDLMEHLAKFTSDGDYQNWLINAWPIPGALIDEECSVFQSMNDHSSVIAIPPRVVNGLTGQWPCILHFRGG